MKATPDSASLALNVTVTGVVCQALSAPDCVVTGGLVSMRTCWVFVGPQLPARSRARMWKYQMPSVLPV